MIFKVTDNFPSTTGIYSISFEGSNKVYIGSTGKNNGKNKSNNGFYQRWKTHILVLRKNKRNFKLQAAYNKYGESAMYFSIIEEIPSEEVLIREQYWIDKYDSYNNGYNTAPLASSCLGIKRSNQIKAKLSKIKKDKRKNQINLYEEDVKSLYNDGDSIKVIANKLNISKYLIREILEKSNIKIKNISEYRLMKIFVYNKSGKLLSTHKNIKDSALYYNIPISDVSNCIYKRIKFCRQIVFSKIELSKQDIEQLNIRRRDAWTKEKKETHSIRLSKWKFIKQIDMDGNIIKIWDNVYDIKNNSEMYKKVGAYINKRSYKGFYWVC